jgi:hypothetical protein
VYFPLQLVFTSIFSRKCIIYHSVSIVTSCGIVIEFYLCRCRTILNCLASVWSSYRYGSEFFSSLLRQTVSQIHQIHRVSFSMGTGGYFSGGKAVRAWNWPLSSISTEVIAWRYRTFPLRTRIHGVLLQHGHSWTFSEES